MAQGDVHFFDQFLEDLNDPSIGHDFSSGNTTVVKLAVVDNTTPPTTATADPRWGAGGGTNFLSNEVNATANYITGGNTCATPLAALNAGVVEYTWGDPAAWSPIAGASTDATWGIMYNNTLAGKQCIGYVDLGGAFDMTGGTLTVDLPNPVAALNQS